MNHTVKLCVVAATAAFVLSSTSERAEAQPAVDAMVLSGIDQDTTAIVRLLAGGLYGFGNFAVDAHVAVEGFLRIDTSKGIAARSLPVFDIGFRYGIKGPDFVGPFVNLGASYGWFSGKPHERKVVDDPDTCETAANMTDCNFRIDKSAAFRFGLGWGFRQSKKTTVAVRVDFTYFLFSVSPFEDQPDGAPIPRRIPRPQDSYAVLVGLEFMHWWTK